VKPAGSQKRELQALPACCSRFVMINVYDDAIPNSASPSRVLTAWLMV